MRVVPLRFGGLRARLILPVLINEREANRLCCSVCDNGVGFAVEALPERDVFSLGLTLIRDRLEAVGGTLAIASAPAAGTQLRATAPLEA